MFRFISSWKKMFTSELQNNTFFNGPFTASFSLFRLFNTVDSKQMLIKSLPMPGFEPRISGVDGNRSTTEPQPLPTK